MTALLIIGIVFIIVGVIGGAITISDDISDIALVFIGATLVGFLMVIGALAYYKSISDKPENQYKARLEAVDKAHKELQKFLIDHPEYKEESGYEKDIYRGDTLHTNGACRRAMGHGLHGPADVFA